MEKLLMGEYVHRLDEKNRLSIPSSMRKIFTNDFVICRQHFIGPYLSIYQSLDKLKEETGLSFNKPGSLYPRDISLDQPGRVPLSCIETEHICQEASPELTIVGALSHIEIWEPNILMEVRSRLQKIDSHRLKIKLYQEYGREIDSILLEIESLMEPIVFEKRRKNGS